MDPMPGSDRRAVAVAHHYEDIHFGPGEFQTGRNRQRAAMDAVETVGVDVMGKPAGAADARDERHLFRLQLFFGQQAFDRVERAKVAAAGTPLAGTRFVVFRLETNSAVGFEINQGQGKTAHRDAPFANFTGSSSFATMFL
jgi:hypothetical protein